MSTHDSYIVSALPPFPAIWRASPGGRSKCIDRRIDRQWDIYATYSGILVVMHHTFLDMDWELRLSYHAMIPPYNWSNILLRPGRSGTAFWPQNANALTV